MADDSYKEEFGDLLNTYSYLGGSADVIIRNDQRIQRLSFDDHFKVKVPDKVISGPFPA